MQTCDASHYCCQLLCPQCVGTISAYDIVIFYSASCPTGSLLYIIAGVDFSHHAEIKLERNIYPICPLLYSLHPPSLMLNAQRTVMTIYV